jgi:UDP-GlcNAc3NAcA epimerase
MLKIITVIGARPQFVKAATVSRAIKEHNKLNKQDTIQEIIVHTGQHYDANMSDVFFEEMDIPKPTYTLGVGGGTHGAMTGRQLEKVEEVLLVEKPDYVLVYGDTNSTLAGALAAVKLHIPVLHVEAGLRSFNMRMPEEINRILTDQISSILFCPTDTAIKNLNNEGFSDKNILVHNVGDVMHDAAMYYAPKSVKPNDLGEVSKKFALVTIHRAENTDDLTRLTEIVEALNELVKTMDVVCPMHPRTKQTLEDSGLVLDAKVLAPVSYFEMLWLLKHCKIVLTDSGGLQKEAYFFKKPCVTLRDQTEWVELITAGVNRLTPIKCEKILAAASLCEITDNSVFNQEALYGDGNSAVNIVKIIANS